MQDFSCQLTRQDHDACVDDNGVCFVQKEKNEETSCDTFLMGLKKDKKHPRGNTCYYYSIIFCLFHSRVHFACEMQQFSSELNLILQERIKVVIPFRKKTISREAYQFTN
jgi:hypothetical protein